MACMHLIYKGTGVVCNFFMIGICKAPGALTKKLTRRGLVG